MEYNHSRMNVVHILNLCFFKNSLALFPHLRPALLNGLCPSIFRTVILDKSLITPLLAKFILSDPP